MSLQWTSQAHGRIELDIEGGHAVGGHPDAVHARDLAVCRVGERCARRRIRLKE